MNTLKELRAKQQANLAELAKAIDKDQSYVVYILCRQIRERAIQIADMLNEWSIE